MKEIDPRQINKNKLLIPKFIDGDKSPSINNMGYIFLKINPVGLAFIRDEAQPEKTVLEIGCGFSNVTIEALRAGIGSYIANDLLEEHLHILLALISEAFGTEIDGILDRLKFLVGRFPNDFSDVSMKYDAIFIDKVIHFMTPLEIIEFIRWSKNALKKNGKLYVTAVSPYSKTYEVILSQYKKNVIKGELFPGHFINIMKNISPEIKEKYPNFTVPNEVVLFSRKDLINVFKSENMIVLESYSLKMPSDIETIWHDVPDDLADLSGVIVMYH